MDLTKNQCAAIAVDLLPMLEKEARERQGTRTDLNITPKMAESGESREKAGEKGTEIMPDLSESREKAGEMLGVG